MGNTSREHLGRSGEKTSTSKEKLVTPGIVSEVFPIFLYPFLILVPRFLLEKSWSPTRPTRPSLPCHKPVLSPEVFLHNLSLFRLKRPMKSSLVTLALSSGVLLAPVAGFSILGSFKKQPSSLRSVNIPFHLFRFSLAAPNIHTIVSFRLSLIAQGEMLPTHWINFQVTMDLIRSIWETRVCLHFLVWS